MGVTISEPGVSIPPDILTNEDIVKLVPGTDVEWIAKRTGMDRRHVSYGKNVFEMAIDAAKDLQEKIGFDRDEVDGIMVATNRHDAKGGFPSYAARVGDALGMERYGEDLFSGCPGLINNIIHAYALIKSGIAGKILVIGSERLTDMSDYNDRGPAILFGDGAGAFLIEDNPEAEGIVGIVRGRKFNHYYEDGTCDLGLIEKEGKKLLTDELVRQQYLYMNGREVYRFAVPTMTLGIANPPTFAPGYTMDDLDVVIPHQANARIIEQAVENAGFTGRVLNYVAEFANVSTASTALAEHQGKIDDKIRHGDLALHISFGAGLNWTAVVNRTHYER